MSCSDIFGTVNQFSVHMYCKLVFLYTCTVNWFCVPEQLDTNLKYEGRNITCYSWMQGTEHYILLLKAGDGTLDITLECRGRNITYYSWMQGTEHYILVLNAGDGTNGILFVMHMKVYFNFVQWHSLTVGTDKLMDGRKFRSGLTEVSGDGIYKCITMNQISLDPLTDIWP